MLALLLFGALTSCARLDGCSTRRGLPIVSIEVLDRTGPSAAFAVDQKVIDGAVRQRIESGSRFALRAAKKDEVPWQLTITVQMAAERTADAPDGGVIDPSLVRRSLGLTMSLAELGGRGDAPPRRFETDVIRVETLPRVRPPATLAEQTVGEGMKRLELSISLSEGTPEAVLSALESADPHTRAEAVAAAGRRKLAAAVEPLMAMVRNDDEEEENILKAIGALVAIGDERAVSALIDAARRRSPAYIVQILFAVAELGGTEAEAYLFTVQSGHPDPGLRETAQEALRELERRKGQQAPPKHDEK